MTDTHPPSTDLEISHAAELDPSTRRHLNALLRESQRLAMTSVVPRSITHKREQVNGTWQSVEQPIAVIRATVFAVVRYGEVFGFPPAVALNKIDVVEGRLEPRYDALAGLMMAAGHQVRYREMSPERATVAVRRAEDIGDPDAWQVLTYTVDDAKAAGLIKDNPNERERQSAWVTHRADMLVSKAIKRACRRFTPDVLIRSDNADLIEGASVAELAAPVQVGPITGDVIDVDANPTD